MSAFQTVFAPDDGDAERGPLAPHPLDSVSAERVPVLVVDDRRDNLVALEAALGSAEYDIVLAQGGEEGLARLLDRDFAVILLDVAMPGLDGYETARMIREREKTRHIPIVFVTAFMTNTAHVFRGYEHGAVDYLVKPLDVHALKMKVAVFADLYRYAREIERTSAALARAEHHARVLGDALYDVTFEDAPIGIAHVSGDISWLRANSRMATILRTTPEDLRGRSMLDFIHPDDRLALEKEMKRVLAGDAGHHRMQCRMVDREGNIVWIQLSISLIRDPAGQSVQLAIIEDISEEKRLSEALERSERRFARLRNSGLLGIYEEDGNGVVVDANDAFLEMVGYTPEDVARGAVRLDELIGLDGDNDLRAGTAAAREWPFVRKDGRHGAMLAGAVANGSVIGFTLDVTALREAQQLRARSALELETSLRARDDFLSILAHELRNPLTPLTMQIASLRAATASSKEPINGAWLDGQLAIVQRAAARLARLSEELLTVSRTTVGGFSLAREEIDLVALVRDVVERSRGELERARCTVTINATGAVRGKWDRLALERVVSQLLSNAMKYGAGRPIEISVGGDAQTASMSVRDHGIGIPEDQREHLFERFARFAPLHNYGGFGVGLWLVRRVVEAHAGEISLAQSSEEGARFDITLPRGAEHALPKKEEKPMSQAPASVLLVDDDDDIREILEMSLSGAGYKVRSAANGREALDAIESEVPDVVLLDMMMPVMSGPEFLARVRADERFRTMPVLVVTAWPGEGATLKGAQGVLAKPVDLSELVRTIDRTVH